MSETGQPGAATPGEHGDGAGQHDDPGRSGSGWAPPSGGWSRAAEHEDAREQTARWQPEAASGWRTSSTRHGDLPAPLAGLPGATEPPARVNGHHANGVRHAGAEANGVHHPGAESPAGRPAPVSAPPGSTAEDRRDPASDRLVVPAQRPAPPQEHGSGEPDSGPARHSTVDPAAGHSARWADPGLPTSAPPGVQVPPVGTAASGFEVPPGFRAPTAERPSADEPPAAPRGWRDPLAPQASSEPGRTPDRAAGHADDAESGRAAQGPGAGDAPRAGESPAIEPDWSGPSWNRPSWGSGWAPPWSRQDGEPASRSTPGDPAPGWVAEPNVPYEPARVEPTRPYEPVRADPPRGHDVARDEPEQVASPEPASAAGTAVPAEGPSWAGGRPAMFPTGTPPESSQVEPADRPSWAGGRPAPTSGPPADRPSWASSAPTSAPRVEPASASRADRPSPAGGSDPAPTSAPPARPSWAGSAPTSAPPAVRPSWAGGPEPAPTSAPPAVRPSWAGEPAPTSASPGDRPSWSGPPPTDPPPPPEAPPAPTGPPPAPPVAPPAPAGPALAAERPSWTGRSPATPASEPRTDRADWSEGRLPAAPVERPSWPASRSASPPRANDAGEPSGPARPETRSAAPFRLRPETPEPSRAAPAATGPSPAATAPTPTGSVPAPATSGSGRSDRPSAAPAPTSAPPYAARRSAPDPASPADPADGARLPDQTSAVLPQRVPAEPDVPVVPEPPAVEPPAETPELARIATHLRRDDEPAPLRERPEGFDVNAILDAVREVAGVRDAALRRTPAGAHSLRLDLADGADPAEVSRQVARLLQDRMGLAAAPQNLPGLPTTPPPPVRRRAAEPRSAEPRSAEPRSAEPRSAERRAPEPRSAEPRDAGVEPRTGEVRATGSAAAGRGEATPAGSEQQVGADGSRRRRASAPHRGRATVEEPGSVSAAPAGAATGSPATLGTSYSGGQVTTTESAPSRPLDTGGTPGPRVVIDHVQVSTFGLDANVEVRLLAGGESAAGHATGPAVDGYVLRLCAVAAAAAVDELLRGAENAERGRCFVEHAAVVPFGNCEVATVVVLLVCEGWVEQLAGSALVAGDPRQAVVRATLAAVNRRLEALLS
nr:hypothetical protein [Micromonospora coriariae]